MAQIVDMEKVESKERTSHSNHGGVSSMTQSWTVDVVDLKMAWSCPARSPDRVSHTAMERGL
jgi:hypothetical protein